MYTLHSQFVHILFIIFIIIRCRNNSCCDRSGESSPFNVPDNTRVETEISASPGRRVQVYSFHARHKVNTKYLYFIIAIHLNIIW